jgi:hypothetical protein
MKRALLGTGVGVALALALVGCSKNAVNNSSEPFEWSIGAALGGTGGILLIPLVALIIIASFITMDHDAYSARWVWGAAITLAAIILALWITAVWMGGLGL